MAYTPLNLQNGQVLTAEDLQHMEQGIADVLPQNPGAYQYPATDGDGNMVWADRLAYSNKTYTEVVSVQSTGTPIYNFSLDYSVWESLTSCRVVCTGSFGTVQVDTVRTEEGMHVEEQEANLNFEIVVAPDGMMLVFYADGSNLIDGTMTIYTVEETVKAIDPKFLPASRVPVLYSNNNGEDFYLTGMTFSEWVASYQSFGNFWPVVVRENSSQFSGESCKAVNFNINEETIDVYPDTSTYGEYLRVYPDGSTEWFSPPT